MSSGHAGRDLGRILRDAAYVVPRCEECNRLNVAKPTTKPAAVRLARSHVARTGHTVTLLISHWQRVHPVERPS